MFPFPEALRDYIEEHIHSVPLKEVAAAAKRLSDAYRLGDQRGGPPHALHSPSDYLAYLLTRLPATFAATRAAFNYVNERLAPNTPCTSLLDLGAGPGTASWAATETWPQLSKITLLEREEPFITFGTASMQNTPTLQNATWRRQILPDTRNSEPHDLVVISYLLGELSPSDRSLLVSKAWSLTQSVCIIVEPGTPQGFQRILSARQQLIESGGTIIAPCPHQQACPMPNSQWCHFSARLERSSAHRYLKDAPLSYEDEKYSYVAASKIPFPPYPARIVHTPQLRKGHVNLTLCTNGLLTPHTVSSKNKPLYRLARKAQWGDSWLGTPSPDPCQREQAPSGHPER